MAHFIGFVQGDKGDASRVGSKKNGIKAEVRGWDVGIRVELYHRDGNDYLRIYKTGGSNKVVSDKLLFDSYTDK